MLTKTKKHNFTTLLLCAVCLCTASKIYAASLELDDQTASAGSDISLTLSLNGAPNEVVAVVRDPAT